ncbi:recombinase family protein [Stieleria varia]|uniref:DNA-invertase hin n=1 Tax=Stieleria varia TaxID=2528005 RepID=A0A5C6B8P5_9BACT|nr:recombinase family protein [Stieleria varia]TWU07811.1 DNA-invertase hin [Stieleria varia]
MSKPKNEAAPKIRCAIYTRKSHEERLDQEFNSLDSQRDSAECFIASQQAEGWVALPTRYDDGGFSGGNLERPAMKRLLADIEAGEVDCVVVYKVDRLSRSLLDFARIMGTFDEQKVSFVSVTQHFNTTHSMGRLTLNILWSFAQFEREIIGERIRDKIAGQRRRGKWAGGIPVLGYDVDRTERSPKLVINQDEAVRVRRIFAMYLEAGSMLPVVEECERRGWANKVWVTRSGKTRGGRPFDKSAIHTMLTNPIYAGRIKHKEQTFNGQHDAIVEKTVFDEVQRLLKANSNGRGRANVNIKLAAHSRRTIKPAADTDEAEPRKRRGKFPRVSRLMALAIQLDEMIRRGEVRDATELAILYDITQSRMSKIRAMTLLAPDIQEAILNLPQEIEGRCQIHEKGLRPIRSEVYFDRQPEMWKTLLAEVERESSGEIDLVSLLQTP